MAEHRIIVRGPDGKFHGKVVDDEELKELNTPKFHESHSQYDPFVKRYKCKHVKDKKNVIYGNT